MFNTAHHWYLLSRMMTVHIVATQFFDVNFIILEPSLGCEISPTRCNNCVFYSQWLYSTCFGWQSHPSSGVQCCIWPHTALYSWWWVRLSPETCTVKPLRIKNAIVASCWTYFTNYSHPSIALLFFSLSLSLSLSLPLLIYLSSAQSTCTVFALHCWNSSSVCVSKMLMAFLSSFTSGICKIKFKKMGNLREWKFCVPLYIYLSFSLTAGTAVKYKKLE